MDKLEEVVLVIFALDNIILRDLKSSSNLYKSWTGDDQNFDDLEVNMLCDRLHDLSEESLHSLVMVRGRSPPLLGNRRFYFLTNECHRLSYKADIGQALLKNYSRDVSSLGNVTRLVDPL